MYKSDIKKIKICHVYEFFGHPGLHHIRNPEESCENTGTGIPVPQEFLQKIPVTVAKNRNSCNPLQNHVPVKNSSRKHRNKKKSSGILFFSVIDPQE
jgi:hypothetical protein